MQKSKLLYPGFVFAALIACAIAFQNCAPQGMQSSSSTEENNTPNETTTGVLEYPDVGTPVVLIPSQSITLKIKKPSLLNSFSNYMWMMKSDDYSLASYYGLVTESIEGSIYISLSVVSSYALTKEMRLYFYDPSSGQQIDTVGLGVLVSPSAAGSQYSADAIAEMCDLRSSYVPTFIFKRSGVALKDALTVFDNGAGVGVLGCTFGSHATVDCLQSSSWPSDWASLSLTIETSNRCGTSTSVTYSP